MRTLNRKVWSTEIMGFVNTVGAHFFGKICGFYQKSADCAENIEK